MVSNASTATQQPCTYLTLPVEIRDQIFDHLLYSEKTASALNLHASAKSMQTAHTTSFFCKN